MAKTEVILTHNVVGLGAESDQVKVAAGYARNFLFPQRLAIPLTSANKRHLEALKQRRAEREAKELSHMTELAATLSKVTLVIMVKTGEDGKLFGSVTAGTIADELRHQFDAAVDKRKIHLAHAIKNLGEQEVELRLHPGVTTTLKVRVDSTTPKPVEAPAPEAKEKEAKGSEKAGKGEKPARQDRTEKAERTEKKRPAKTEKA